MTPEEARDGSLQREFRHMDLQVGARYLLPAQETQRLRVGVARFVSATGRDTNEVAGIDFEALVSNYFFPSAS
jgi:hypothetical protein